MVTIIEGVEAQDDAGQERGPRAGRKRLRLSDAALILLAQAAQRTDGLVLPPPATLRVRGKALELILRSLLKAGLVREVPVEAAEQVWRHGDDGLALSLKVTAAGLVAVGAEPPGEHDIVASAAADTGGLTLEDDCPLALICGGDADRRMTKKSRLVALLSSAEGASIVDLSVELGWQVHTVRGCPDAVASGGAGLDQGEKGRWDGCLPDRRPGIGCLVPAGREVRAQGGWDRGR